LVTIDGRFSSAGGVGTERADAPTSGLTAAGSGGSPRGPITVDAAPTTVAIIAPTRLCRDGLATALADGETLRVVAAISDRRDQLLGLAGLRRAVIVVDAAAGLAATLPLLRSILVECRIVVFGLDCDEDVLVCARHDVAGYLDRAAGIDELTSAIERVSGGELVCPPSVTSVLIRQVGTSPAIEPAPRRLTPRELEIIALLEEGLSNKQIAARLQIEVATVKNHVHNVLEKLDVKRRSQAARRCREAADGLAFSYELARNKSRSSAVTRGLDLDPV
jgi:two-component system, NarL family, nitrate/nitrite response regulator NarL